MTTKIVEVGPKLYLNGFPKSGTHLLDGMAMHLLPPADAKNNWLGSFSGFGFSKKFSPHVDNINKALEEAPPKRYAKGHLGWRPDFVKGFIDNHWCKAFIFRDFRDVAVSAAYHAQKEKNSAFPEIEYYRSLEYDEVLKRVITGDENIDGVMDRWELYAPWLDEEWVLKLAYEDVIENNEWACELFIKYIYGRTGSYYGDKPVIEYKEFNKWMNMMMIQLEHPETSPTYRNGRTSEWKKHFTNEHKELFKESDKNNWLIRLGYADDRNW